MEAKFVQGSLNVMVDHTPSGAIAAGEVTVVNGSCRIPHTDIAANALGSLSVAGIYDIVKDGTGAVSFTNGDNVFWSAGTNLATATTSDTWCGECLADAGATATTVRVLVFPRGTLFSGNLAASGTLSVTGAATLSSTLAVTGASTLTGAVTGASSIKSTSATAGIGYATGAGGTVTQITSRTTGVTLDKVTGNIVLFSAAGSATPFSFTLTNSTIAAGDTVVISQKSGTDKYTTQVVTAVAAGSCQITLANASGTTTEQPVFNFVVIKGVAA